MTPNQDPGRASTVDLSVGCLVHETASPTLVPRLWSARAISARWTMSRMQVYRAHRAGRLRGYRVLGTLRFLEADILSLLREEGLPVDGDIR